MACLLPPQCLFCRHLLIEGGDLDGPDCRAFHEIPDAIFRGEYDHSRPFPGDGGIRFALAADMADEFDEAMERSGELYDAIRAAGFEAQASYAVSLAYRVRFNLNVNARSAMHTIELRSTPQGHPAYRRVAQAMHKLIEREAGHQAIAAMMTFVDHSSEAELERLDAERRAEAKRTGSAV